MSHFSPVPPEERVYAKNYRQELQHLEAQLVEVSGRVKEFRDHPERSDLQSLLLVNLIVVPLPRGKPRNSIKLTHLWVLTKHIVRAGVEPKRGRRLTFLGSVYAYYRLGGKSKQRGLHGSHDFSILPMGPSEVKEFKPGIDQRYHTNEVEVKASDSGGSKRGQEPRGKVGQDTVIRADPHPDHRHRDDWDPEQGPRHGDLPDHDHQRVWTPGAEHVAEAFEADHAGAHEDPRD